MKDTYAVTNNHYIGKATVNALEIASLLKEEPVPAPQTLLRNIRSWTALFASTEIGTAIVRSRVHRRRVPEK